MSVGRIGAVGWLRILCAMLLLSLGLAHKPADAQTRSDPASSFYVLPDGSYASICYDGGQGHRPDKTGWSGCAACRIGPDIIVPAPPVAHIPVRRDGGEVGTRLWTVGSERPAVWPATPARGPPDDFA